MCIVQFDYKSFFFLVYRTDNESYLGFLKNTRQNLICESLMFYKTYLSLYQKRYDLTKNKWK